MQTDYLRYLLKVVECGSMNKAANDLFITQPALVKAMKKLEETLNCRLLDKTKAGVSLTDKGQIVYQDAIKILEIEDQWLLLADDTENIAGNVRVGIINSAASQPFINQLLFECRENYPKLNVILKEYRTDDLLKQFEMKKVDIGIGMFVEGKQASVEEFAQSVHLVMEPLWEDQFYVFLNAANPLAKQDYLQVSDLEGLRLVAYSDAKDFISGAIFSKFFKRENIFYMNSMVNMMQAVLKNDAVLFNSASFARQQEYVASGEIVYKELADAPLPIIYYMMYPQPEMASPAEQVVIEWLKKSLKGL